MAVPTTEKAVEKEVALPIAILAAEVSSIPTSVPTFVTGADPIHEGWQTSADTIRQDSKFFGNHSAGNIIQCNWNK